MGESLFVRRRHGTRTPVEAVTGAGCDAPYDFVHNVLRAILILEMPSEETLAIGSREDEQGSSTADHFSSRQDGADISHDRPTNFDADPKNRDGLLTADD